jgi:heptosyltransferase-2
MHTACAAKTDVLAIFGSTVRQFGFFPYNSTNTVLENNSLSCRPCSHIGRSKCPQGHLKCLTEITPEMVFNCIKGKLNIS